MRLWLGSYFCLYLSICLSVFLCLVVGFRPRFHSLWSRPLCNCPVKKINQGIYVLTHDCLPPLLASSICGTRLIILTGGKSNHKIKNSCGQLAVSSRHPPLRLQIYFFIISENADHIDCLYGGGGGGERWVL